MAIASVKNQATTRWFTFAAAITIIYGIKPNLSSGLSKIPMSSGLSSVGLGSDMDLPQSNSRVFLPSLKSGISIPNINI